MAGFTFWAAAAKDVAEAYDWDEGEEPGLGERFLHAVGDAAGRASAGPELYRVVRGDVRRVLVGPFPYGLLYRVLRRRVAEVACYHPHRDPRGWHRRR